MDAKILRKIIKEEIHKIINKPTVNINLHIDFDCPKELLSILYKYIRFISNELNINTECSIILTKNRVKYHIPTLALFKVPESELIVYVKNRNMADVLRSITHELIHKEQMDTGKFKPGDKIQDIGGDIENEANSKAGIFIKIFGYKNPQIFEMNFEK